MLDPYFAGRTLYSGLFTLVLVSLRVVLLDIKTALFRHDGFYTGYTYFALRHCQSLVPSSKIQARHSSTLSRSSVRDKNHNKRGYD